MSDALIFKTVGVVGGGIMGAGIAEVALRSGAAVTLVEADRESASAAAYRITASLDRGVERGKIEAAQARDAQDRLRLTDELEAMADCELIVEAVSENRAAKTDIFRRLSCLVDGQSAVLASNTSSIPIIELAAAAKPLEERVLGLHFFNPVPVLPLVEIVPSLVTADEVLTKARAFVVDQLQKEPINAPDRAGFTVNALLIPFILSAIRMFEHGLASAEDIDRGMVAGCAHPMGPLALADLIGLDTVLGVAETLYVEYGEQLYGPPPLLRRLVTAGLTGKKTGRGIYSYP